MKARGKSTILLLAGVLVGLSIAPAAQAVSEYIQAQQSPCAVYVDGGKVELDAYLIHENNYVQLRDIGKAVGFNVYWDGANVQIESDKPYTGEPPAPATETDYSQQANPAVFQGDLTREVYNAIREAMENHDAIAGGSMEPVSVGKITPYGGVESTTVIIGQYPAYEIVYQSDGNYACTAKYPEAYQPAAEHTQGYVDGLEGKANREKVEAIAWYVADRITYAVKYPSPGEVLTQDGQVPGACMAYAYSFQFLCNRAEIPCILKHGGNHQWNMVYVDGQWWDVDVTAMDAGDNTAIRSYVTILHDPAEHLRAGHIDEQPNVTAFAKELLVPGSTK